MRASAPARQRECQTADYDSRRTGNRFLDTGSTPVISTQPFTSELGVFRESLFRVRVHSKERASTPETVRMCVSFITDSRKENFMPEKVNLSPDFDSDAKRISAITVPLLSTARVTWPTCVAVSLP